MSLKWWGVAVATVLIAGIVYWSWIRFGHILEADYFHQRLTFSGRFKSIGALEYNTLAVRYPKSDNEVPVPLTVVVDSVPYAANHISPRDVLDLGFEQLSPGSELCTYVLLAHQRNGSNVYWRVDFEEGTARGMYISLTNGDQSGIEASNEGHDIQFVIGKDRAFGLPIAHSDLVALLGEASSVRRRRDFP
jgi:hypothetical protein